VQGSGTGKSGLAEQEKGQIICMWQSTFPLHTTVVVRQSITCGFQIEAQYFSTVNVKFPTDQYEEFIDVLEQLHEIIEKYPGTHSTVIGGDFNEDTSGSIGTRRQQFLNNFIDEHSLTTLLPGVKFVHPNGTRTQP
jgi:hypothetical protein